MLKSIRKYFLAGIAVLLPLTITVWLLYSIFNFIDGVVGSLIKLAIGYYIPGVGFAVTLVIVFLAGLLATNLIGRKLIGLWEHVLLRTPLASPIYKTIKQIVDTVGRRDEQAFRQVVLVEYPRRESWVIGFLVGEAEADMFGEIGENHVKLFVPTVPNPTSGFLIIVSREDIVPLPISVEDGFRVVLSAGIVIPNNNSRPAPPPH